jgi:transcriptional regulator with XRE-family HTH domain
MTTTGIETAAALRRRFGNWLKVGRESANVTQLDLSRALGHNYVSMVSQVERGRSLIPAQDLAQWATALKVRPKEFAAKYLYYCHPEASSMLGGVNVFEAEGLPPIPKTSATNPGGRKPKSTSKKQRP